MRQGGDLAFRIKGSTRSASSQGSTPSPAVSAEALHEARLYAEAIVDTVREPLLILDGDLCALFINRSFSSLFEVSSQEVIGRSVHDIGSEVWKTRQLPSLLKAVVEGGEAISDVELPYDSKTLGRRSLLLSARGLRREFGEPSLILVAIDDVTDQRQVESLLRENDARRREEARLRKRQLELTNALRVSTVGELATGLAHELNQPLSSIANLVEACTQYVRAGIIDPPKLLDLLSDAAEQSLRAAEIVAHLRSFVDKGEPQLEPIDLAEIVTNAPHLLLREFERARITLQVELPERRLLAHADRIQIEQVIVNFLQNAVDSIQDAGGDAHRIELSARSNAAMAEVAVRDTGTGISEIHADRIFDPFFTTKAKGLGMGLALSRSIIEAHHGRIWVQAPEDGGPGAVFSFSIPLKRAQRRRK